MTTSRPERPTVRCPQCHSLLPARMILDPHKTLRFLERVQSCRHCPAVCNLLFNEDAVATEGTIAEYQRQNHASIARQRALKVSCSPLLACQPVKALCVKMAARLASHHAETDPACRQEQAVMVRQQQPSPSRSCKARTKAQASPMVQRALSYQRQLPNQLARSVPCRARSQQTILKILRAR